MDVEDVDVGGAEFLEAGFDAEVEGFGAVAGVGDLLCDIGAAFVACAVLWDAGW